MPTDKERIASLEGQVEELRNYIRDYLKGKEMKECITHHHACDCREELHKNEIAELQSTIDELRAENKALEEINIQYKFALDIIHQAQKGKDA